MRVYEVEKAVPAAQATARAAAEDPDISGSGGTDTAAAPAESNEPWTIVPAGWTRVPGERPMRFATFRAAREGKAIDIVVSQFPGDVGGLLANVNRWRQQVGLEPVDEAKLPSVVTPFTSGAMTGHTMVIEGAGQHMLAAAISEPAADRTWFVKAMAAPDVAAAHRADVEAFAKSFGAKP